MQDSNETECFIHIPEVDRSLELPVKLSTKRNDDVDTTDLQPALAFQKFAGTVFNPDVDYSDSVAERRLAEMSSQRTVFTNAPRSYESPMERYARMREELTLFERDIKLMQEQERKREEGTELTTLLARQISSLQLQLGQLEPSAQNLNSNLQTSHRSSAQLLRQLQELAASNATEQPQTADENKSDQKGAPKRVTYELFMESAASGGPSEIHTLERRVAELEKIMGTPRQTDEEGHDWPDVLSGLTAMGAQLKAVDWRKLDSHARTLRTLLTEMKAMGKRRERQKASDHQTKLSELHAMMSRWDAAAVCLPTVIDRLSTLRSIHQENGAVLTRLASLEALSTQIDTSLRTDSQSLQQASDSLVTNAQTMQKNVMALASRMDALTDKIAQLS